MRYNRQVEEIADRPAEVSWALHEHPDNGERKAVEARLLAMRRSATEATRPGSTAAWPGLSG